MRFLFLKIYGTGHVNPSLELVKYLINMNNEVIYFTHERFKDKLISIGAKPMIYGDNFTLTNYSSSKSFIKSIYPGSIQGMLPIILDYIKQNNDNPFDCIIFDSFALAGYFTSKIYNIPAIRSSSSFPGGYYECFKNYYKDEDEDINKSISILENYGLKLNKDFYHPKDDCLQESSDSILSIVYTIKDIQPDTQVLNHGEFLYTGVSIPKELPTLINDTDLHIMNTIDNWKENNKIIVYFSLGTVLTMTKTLVDILIQVFNSFNGEYKAIVTGIKDDLAKELQENKPPLQSEHLKLVSFAPQLHILSKVDIFISHCGMNSLNESLYYGVPIIALPGTEEQSFNANVTREKQVGIILNKDNITTEILSKTLITITKGNYKENAKNLSQKFKKEQNWKENIDKIISFIKNK